jgi:O-antigen/teichoic acid export membrane protein
MTLIGTIGMFGLGTVLIGELPSRNEHTGLVVAALMAAGIGSFALALIFAILGPRVDPRFSSITGTPGEIFLFASGVALTAVTMVFDQATIGLMRGGQQLFRNIVFAVTKLPALLVCVIAARGRLGNDVTLTWVAGMALSLFAVAISLRRSGSRVISVPEWGVLRGLGKTAIAHSWLNIVMMLPFAAVPVLVTIVVSASANAAFYAAWTITSFLKVIPTHLSTVLFAVAAGHPHLITKKLRFTLRLSILLGFPGMIALGLGAHLALSIFGASYASQATVPMWLLIVSYVPSVPKAQYVAVCRAQARIVRAAAVMTAAAALEVLATIIGGMQGGLIGLSTGLLLAQVVEGIATAPAVYRAAVGQGRHRPAVGQGRHRRSSASGVTVPRQAEHSAQAWSGPSEEGLEVERGRSVSRSPLGEEKELQRARHELQQAGIVALQSLARSVAVTGPIPIVFDSPNGPMPRRGESLCGMPEVSRATGPRAGIGIPATNHY